MTIFIKPSADNFCIAVFSRKESFVELVRVAFVENEAGCIDVISDSVTSASLRLGSTTLTNRSSANALSDRLTYSDRDALLSDRGTASLGEKIEEILFDGSVYAHTGISIREKTDFPVRIFKEKGNVHDRVAAQQEWLSTNMKYRKDMKESDADYSTFINLLSGYESESKVCDTVAVDLMADAARYFRRF